MPGGWLGGGYQARGEEKNVKLDVILQHVLHCFPQGVAFHQNFIVPTILKFPLCTKFWTFQVSTAEFGWWPAQ